jgi:peptidyl-Asp metalloendopeptidase
MFTKTATTVLLSALTAPALFAQGQPQQGALTPLFETVPAQTFSHFYADDAAVQQRNVLINMEMLDNDDSTPTGPQNGVLLNLFPGVEFVGVFTGFENAYGGGYITSFDLQGVDNGHAWFSVLNDGVVATVRAGEVLYKVNYVGDGQATISLIDENLSPECGTNTGFEIQPGNGSGSGGSGNGNRTHDHEVDMMVVYTDNARAANGGTNGMNALINLAIYETNLAYSQSDVAQRLMLVHTEELNYVEHGNDLNYLSELQDPADGIADNVHTLRNEYGADLVSMIYTVGSYCGVGYVMTTLSSTFEAFGFTVVQDSCATGNYSFGHELGHNMGAQHDRANAGTGLTSYSYGWRTTDNAYRSVMAYSPGTRLPFFSNPNKTAPNGLALGTANDDNARTLDYSATTITAFRNSVDYGQRVSTMMAANNGFAGNMFDIEPQTDIEIWALMVNTSSTSTETFDVWVRDGSYVGNENSSAGWVLWGSDSVTGSGQDIATFIYPGTHSFKAGQTYGIYIDMASYPTGGGSMRYTNGAPRTFENNYLKITTGVGKGSGFAGSTFNDRIWNGALYYRGDVGQVQLATTMASNNGFAGNMFDVDVHNDITVNSFEINVDASATGAAGPVYADVWMRTGSYVGNETNSAAWTYVGSEVASIANPIDTYTRIAVGDIDLKAGTTYAFYIHLASYAAGQRLKYTSGTVGDYYENSDMRIHIGAGRSGDIFTGATFTYRTWNGRINYSANHAGPHIWVHDLKGNQVNHIHMKNCTPGSRQYLSWSIAGGGPQNSPWGTIYLTNPYHTLPWVVADSNGDAIVSTFSPAAASGLHVWLQSLDLSSLGLSNGADLDIE